MIYDIIGQQEEYVQCPDYFTIGNLIELCLEHPDKNFRFLGTLYTVGNLHSWRGSYDLAAISYKTGKHYGSEIAKSMLNELELTHSGWKGGSYKYTRSDEFYVASKGTTEEYKVCGYEIDKEANEVVLLTKIDHY